MSESSSDSEERDAVVEEDGVVARTVDLLKQGGPSAALALVLVSSVPLAIVFGCGALVVYDSAWGALDMALAFLAACSVPIALHAGPLAVFAVSLETRPRLVATLGRIWSVSGSLIATSITTVVSFVFLGLAIAVASQSLDSLAVAIGLAPIVIVLFLLAEWLQGASLVFVARSMVAPSLRAPRGERVLYHEVATGLVLHGTILAVAGPGAMSGRLGPRTPEVVSAVVALVAVPLAAILGSAIAVAIAGRPRAPSEDDHGS